MSTQSALMFTLMALCGGVGAVCRFLVDSTVNKRNRLNFPLGTIVVNMSACLLLGLLTGWVSSWNATDAQLIKFILGTGLLGGYSTFSTASVEGYRLIQHQHYLRALTHTGGMLVISLGAGILGVWLGSL
ncbi:fluoride efflux transporter FluC [Bifidobacterium aquikefiri]|mgnify:CR=1 FL=1|uniref:Fluoride-specific ion channel FluC n=1 Tax=Bifidobacterium aquikefiri TaxID=1653207 RepID=A0A261G3M8_9BIFI|nr:CrcB family protein [Bifidobacterium aquikefiri]OZG66032.1 camphor resistance protein CrcB [Bifidobacterium aquikefiri]